MGWTDWPTDVSYARRAAHIHRCQKNEGVPPVKKLIALAVVLAGGFGIWRRFQQDRAERDLWTEATSASGRS